MWWTCPRQRALNLAQLFALCVLCEGCSDSTSPASDAGGNDDREEQDAGTDARVRPRPDGAVPGKGDASGGSTDETCARVDARPTPKATAVWIVVNPLTLDGRLSTADNTNETTNREMLHELLFGPAGVVTTLHDTIQFGWSSLSATPGGHLGGMCPSGKLVPAGHDTHAEMERELEDTPYNGGASWAALDLISKEIEKRSEPTDDTILLIQGTFGDGSCDVFQSGPELQKTAVERIAETGVRVSAVTLLAAAGQAQDYERMNAVARARDMQLAQLGKGSAYASNQADAIRKAIEDSVNQAVSCQVRLEGKVEQGQECEGEVLLAGQPLRCNDADGFRLVDESTLELTGEACTRLRSDATTSLSANFPCDVFIPL